MYRTIGYRTKSPAAVLIPAATRLLQQFGSKAETEIAESFRVFSDRRFVKSTAMHDYLQLNKADAFQDAKGQPLKDILHITFAVLANCGFGDYRPNVLTYDTNALMTIDDVITEVLNSHIQLPTADNMDGEKTGFETFRTHIPQVIRELAILNKLRPWYVEHFRRYINDLIYRLDMGETQASSLDQFDLTLLTCYAHKDSKYNRTVVDNYKKWSPTPARDSDPETAEVMSRIKSVVELGPWIRFHRLLSNTDRNELVYMLGPIVNQLPLISGYRIERGPFFEQFMNVQESLTWGDAEAFKAELQRVQYLDSADTRLNMTGVRVPVKRTLWTGVQSRSSLTPISLDYKPSINVQIYRTDKEIQIAHEWRSAVHRRLVSTRSGASADTMLVDMATKMASAGEVAHSHLNIDGFGLIDPDDEVEARRIDTTTSSSSVNNKNVITEKVYYVKGGRFVSADAIDMTLFYNRIGNIMYRPAFAEYFRPTVEWFRTPDSAAVDFIISQLDLSPIDAARSKEAILVSHNVEKYKRVTGANDARVSTILNVADYCRYVSGLANK